MNAESARGGSASPSFTLAERKVLIVGGSGFVGGALVQHLSAAGAIVTVPTRRRERAKGLLVYPTTSVVEADVHRAEALRELVDGQDAVINLVGILRGGNGRPYGRGFRRAHVELPASIAAAMRHCGVRRLLQVSALQASAAAPSGYLRSKHDGEAALRAADLDLTILRPSVIFGRGDAFLTLFARLLRLAPLFPLACPQALFQPLWVEDVAAVLTESLARTASIGCSYDLCGPRRYSLRELVEYVGALTQCRRIIVDLPDRLSWLQAAMLELIPGGPMSRDNYLSMQLPSICADGCTLPFGRQAAALEAIAPTYLGTAPQFPDRSRFRLGAGR